MMILDFSEQECEIIFNCVQAIYKVEDILKTDFETVLGFTRKELLYVIRNWDVLSFEDKNVEYIISGVLNNITGYPHSKDWEILCYTGKFPSEIEILTKRYFNNKNVEKENLEMKTMIRNQELVCALRTINQFQEPDSLTSYYSYLTDKKLGRILCYFNLSFESHLHQFLIFSYGCKIIFKQTETIIFYCDITQVELLNNQDGKCYIVLTIKDDKITIFKDNIMFDDVDIIRIKRYLEKVDKKRKSSIRNFI